MHSIEIFIKNTPVDINDDSLGVKRVAYRGKLVIDTGLAELPVLRCRVDSEGTIQFHSKEYPTSAYMIRVTDTDKLAEYTGLLATAGADYVNVICAKIIADHLDEL